MQGLERVCVDFEAYFPLECEVPLEGGNGGVEGGKALFEGSVIALVGEEEAGENMIEWVGASEAFDIRELEGDVSFSRPSWVWGGL